MKPAEAGAYLAGDQVTCLICGHPSRALGQHVRHAHQITAKAYKLRFGLPVTKGLEPADKRAARSAQIKATRAAGRLPQSPPPGVTAGAPRPSYVARDMSRVTLEDVMRLIERLRAGDTITTACGRHGVPSWTAMHDALRRHPAWRDSLNAAVEALPFAQQARMKRLGPRFSAALAGMHGLSHAEAAARLGVSADVVQRHRRKAPTS